MVKTYHGGRGTRGVRNGDHDVRNDDHGVRNARSWPIPYHLQGRHRHLPWDR